MSLYMAACVLTSEVPPWFALTHGTGEGERRAESVTTRSPLEVCDLPVGRCM